MPDPPPITSASGPASSLMCAPFHLARARPYPAGGARLRAFLSRRRPRGEGARCCDRDAATSRPASSSGVTASASRSSWTRPSTALARALRCGRTDAALGLPGGPGGTRVGIVELVDARRHGTAARSGARAGGRFFLAVALRRPRRRAAPPGCASASVVSRRWPPIGPVRLAVVTTPTACVELMDDAGPAEHAARRAADDDDGR